MGLVGYGYCGGGTDSSVISDAFKFNVITTYEVMLCKSLDIMAHASTPNLIEFYGKLDSYF